MTTVDKAIENLRPNSIWQLHGTTITWTETVNENGEKTGEFIASNFIWDNRNTTICPTKQEIDAELLRLEKEWIDTQYQRNRRLKYPPLEDLADALYWQSKGDVSKLTAYLAACEAVKQKYPRGA